VAGNLTNGTYCNNVTILGVPPNGNNVSDFDTSCVGIFAPAVNVIKTSAPSSVSSGGNVTNTINVTNTGSVPLTISVIDILPPNLTYLGAIPSESSFVPPVLTWSGIASISPGSSFVIVYNVTSTVAGTYANNVSVTGVPPNGNNVSDNDSSTFTITPGGGDDDDDDEPGWDYSFSSSCNGNTITVTDNGDNPIEDVGIFISGDTSGLYSTNSAGQVTFSGCGLDIAIYVSPGSPYEPGSDSFDETTIACSQCVLCDEDSDCESGECNEGTGQCIEPPQCECGQIVNNQCVAYQCCADSDCPGGQVCESNTCVPKYECDPNGPGPEDDNDDCSGSEYCEIAANETGGFCKPVPGICGQVVNHVFIPFNCGDETGCPVCPSGYSCYSHNCLPLGITCPESGSVGSSVVCHATRNETPCSFCQLSVLAPDGSVISATSDANGDYVLALSTEGPYNVTLIGNGKPVKTLTVKALLVPGVALPLPSEGFPFPLWILLILLLIPILYYLLSRITVFGGPEAMGASTVALSPPLLESLKLNVGDNVILKLGKFTCSAKIVEYPLSLLDPESNAKIGGKVVVAGSSVLAALNLNLNSHRATKGKGFEDFSKVFGLKITKQAGKKK
jgi:uncharacterized repeat protein (TIGR01451 family)